jgi:hypothetical protein
MPFTKGQQKIERSGMKLGQKSAKAEAWERIGEYLITEGSERYLRIISEMPDDKFVKEFQSIIEYFKPKLNRSYNDIAINQVWDEINTVFESRPPSPET